MSTCSRALSLALITAPGLIGSSLTFACFSPIGQTSATTAEPSSSGDESTAVATESTVAPTAGPTSEGTTGEPTSVGTVTATSATVTSLTPTTGGDCGPCLESAPYCGPDGTCVDCGGLAEQGASCSDVAPGLPKCGPAGLCVECVISTDCPAGVCDEQGQCVECTSAADCPGNLACDLDTHTCNNCSEHADCPETACQLDVGTCFPKDARHWYVDGLAKGCQTGSCSPDIPCCEIQQAFMALSLAPDEFHVVHVAAGDYIEPVRLDAARRVAVLGTGKARIAAAAAGKPSVLVGSGGPTSIDAKLYLAGLQFSGLGEVAFSCTRASVAWLDDIEVAGFFGNSLYATECDVVVRRSRFIGNVGGLGVALDGTLRVENSVVSGITTSATLLVQGGALDLLYSTVTLQHPVAGGLLFCLGGSATIRNSVVVSDQAGTQIDCNAALTVTTSLTSEDELVVDSSIEQVDPADLPLQFVNFAGHDLRPVQDGALRDGAVWEESDPPTDIAGLPRPTRPGSLDYAGAYEP